MTAFASQRNLLIDLADSFSNSINDVAGFIVIIIIDIIIIHIITIIIIIIRDDI